MTSIQKDLPYVELLANENSMYKPKNQATDLGMVSRKIKRIGK